MRRTHYELAFEAYLASRQMSFVAVEDTRCAARLKPGMKLFDYLVYTRDARNYLVDVKGRKVVLNAARAGRWEAWVTHADLAGLDGWQRIFGPSFEGVFVFAYWVLGTIIPRELSLFSLAGRHYAFMLVSLSDYRRCQRRRSPRWGTVTISRADFVRMARPVDLVFSPGA